MFQQLLCAFVGSLSFCLLFNVNRKHILPASIGGLLAWAVYLMMQVVYPDSVFLASFVAAAALTVYAEIFARLTRTPATVYLVISAIPLFPGGSLYTTMRYAVEGDWQNFSHQGLQTLLAAIGISTGMICATTLFRSVLRGRKALRARTERR